MARHAGSGANRGEDEQSGFGSSNGGPDHDGRRRRRLSTTLSDSTVSYMLWTPLTCLPSGLTFVLGLLCGGALSG